MDALPTPAKDNVYWDSACPGFGVKVTPKGRKVFIVLYRMAGAGSRLRKYTIGPYGRVTLPSSKAAIPQPRSGKPVGSWSPTVWRTCSRPSSRSMFRKTVPRGKSPVSCVARLERHGAAAAFTRSPSVT
ncbi:MAG TPA: Arm DNA-binding domain-containing protein [Xanthobacteraceae bacterium]